MQHPGGWQRCTEEPGIAMHAVHHCEQWTANRKRERYNMDIYLIRHGKTKGNPQEKTRRFTEYRAL